MKAYDYLASFTVAQLMVPGEAPAAAATIAADATLGELMGELDDRPALAVVDGEARIGVVDRGCINALPFRCWIFGILCAVELQLKSRFLVGEFWRSELSPERLAKARALKAERRRRGQQVNTMDCLQFGDLTKMHLQHGTRSWFDFSSRRRAKATFRQIEQLRNQVAHAQDLSEEDWPLLVAIAGALPRIFETG